MMWKIFSYRCHTCRTLVDRLVHEESAEEPRVCTCGGPMRKVPSFAGLGRARRVRQADAAERRGTADDMPQALRGPVLFLNNVVGNNIGQGLVHMDGGGTVIGDGVVATKTPTLVSGGAPTDVYLRRWRHDP